VPKHCNIAQHSSAFQLSSKIPTPLGDTYSRMVFDRDPPHPHGTLAPSILFSVDGLPVVRKDMRNLNIA